MQIEKGRQFVLGASGSGKTTLIDILTRLYEPTSGVIKNGDTHIGLQFSVMATDGYVPQDPVMHYARLRII